MSIKGGERELSGELNISEASLKGIKKESAINESSEDKEYIKNVEDQKTVKLSDAGKTDTEEETTIDFLKEEQVNSFTQSKTKASTNKSEKVFGDKTTEQVREEIKKGETEQEKIDPETFVDIAAFIIFLIDASMSTALRWWGKDNTSSPYELPKPKQDKLIKQLATILIKYQAKFSLEWMFLLSIIVLYIPGFIMARDRRKAAIAKPEPAKPVVKQPIIKPAVMRQSEVVSETANPVVQNKPEEIIDMTDQPLVVDETQLEVVKPKRGQGRPRKVGL